jgi:hypothetical protein
MKMLKKSLFAVAMLAVVMPAFAGQLKIHEPWPCSLIPQEVAKIDVVMDVGYYIQIVDQGPLPVVQDTSSNDPYHTYTGCKTTDVKTNFVAQLILSAAPASLANGSWSATATPSVVNPPVTNVEICVTGTGVNIDQLVGGTKGVKVAEVTVKVLPAA